MLLKDLKVGLLQYFIGDAHVYATLLHPEGTLSVFRLLPYSEAFFLIDELVDSLQASLSESHRKRVFNRFSFEWGKKLIPAISEIAEFDVILIVPFGSLHGLPLHAIWIEERKQFLAQWKGISYCQSASLLLRCAERNLARGSDLNKWRFDAHDGDLPTNTFSPGSCVSFGVDVKHGNSALYENVAQTFARQFKKHATLIGSRATVKNSGLSVDPSPDSQWDVICLVSHGYLDSISPEGSGLLLDQRFIGVRHIHAMGEQIYTFRDLPFRHVPPQTLIDPAFSAEILTVSEMRVDCLTNANLVALLGCSTAAGEVRTGDDYSSLASQWLKVGASSVIASLWELDIDFLNEWMPRFLTNWVDKGQPKAIAVQGAINQTLSSRCDFQPYDWAVLGLFGDWV